MKIIWHPLEVPKGLLKLRPADWDAYARVLSSASRVALAPVKPAHDRRKISGDQRTAGALFKMSNCQKRSHCLVVEFKWLHVAAARHQIVFYGDKAERYSMAGECNRAYSHQQMFGLKFNAQLLCSRPLVHIGHGGKQCRN